ncbi:helix-turn-helix domain-containing protein [Desulfoferula mesophila]|uniref:HTH cro/C1-type domain-containing protein n=1 Tax=Desulfoferula mesophila TaxID=3058419 RepID=A0AAU9EV53_9BACT|nr:hypothetical protein FAK_40250 [Desulfoferula mesophilus]
MQEQETTIQFWAAFSYIFPKTGMTQSEFARRAGMAQSTINEMLNRKKGRKLDTQATVARALGLSMLELLTIGDKVIRGESPEVNLDNIAPDIAALDDNLTPWEKQVLMDVLRALRAKEKQENLADF